MDTTETVPEPVARPTNMSPVDQDLQAIPATPPEGLKRQALGIAALAIAAAFLHGDVAAHPHPLLPLSAKVLLGTAGIAWAATNLFPRFGRLLAWISLVGALFALTALFGRHAPLFRPLGDVHGGYFGIVSEWLWPALAVTSVSVRNAAIPKSLHVIHVGALVVATFVLVAPDVSLGQSVHTFKGFESTARMLSLTSMVLLVAIAWLELLLPRTHFETLRKHTHRLTTHAPEILAATMLGGAFISNEPTDGLIAATAMLIAARAGRNLIATSRNNDPQPVLLQQHIGLEHFAVAGVVVIWLLLKTHGLVWTNTDDNIYFYMANRLGDGVLPHVDYFFAHPPLHVLVPGVLFSVFGFSIEFAKFIPLVACAVTGLALYATVRRRLDAATATIGLVLFLFAGEVLKAASNMNGVNLTSMWLALGLWSSFGKAPVRTGMLLGAATMTGFYAVGPSLAIITIAFFRNQRAQDDGPSGRIDIRHGLGLLAAFAVFVGVINLAFHIAAPDTFIDGVYRYHGEKFFHDQRMVEIFGGEPGFPFSILHNIAVMVDGRTFNREFLHHAHLWLGAAVLPAVAALLLMQRHGAQAGLRRLFDPRRLHDGSDVGTALQVWLVGLAFFIEFAMFRELYTFYFALLYPLLAVATAATVTLALRTMTLAIVSRSWTAPFALAALSLPLSHAHFSDSAIDWFDGERADTGIRNRYSWTEPPVLEALSTVTRDIFWSDARIRGDLEPGYRQYLWTKKRTFSVLEDIATFVTERTSSDETIAGASTVAPAIAIVAGRRIAADEADTNNKRFKTGLLSEADYWNTICRDGLRFLVAAPRSYFTRAKLEQMPLMRKYFRLARVFSDPTIQHGSNLEIALFEAIAPRGTMTTCAWMAADSGPAPKVDGDGRH